MTRPWRLARNIGLGLVALIVVVLLAAIVLVQTDWFRNTVREKIIATTEEGTGGKVEVGSFSFRWQALEAVITDFVIHGKEPAGAAPFVRAKKVQVNLRLFTSLRRLVDLSYLGIEKPEANIIVFANGTTNVPEPKDKKPDTDKTVLDTVVDLAVDYFQIRDGAVSFNQQKQPLDVRATNLRAQLWFNLVTRGYKGQLTMQPVYVVSGRNTPVVFTLNLPVALERNRVSFENAKITTPLSALTINGSLEDLKNPKTTARINGQLAMADIEKLADVPLDLKAKGVPQMISVDGNAAVADNRITVDGLRLGMGQSNVEASGTLKDPKGNGALAFKAHLELDELGRLAKVTARPSGVVDANGTAKLDAANNYEVNGNVTGKDVAFSQGTERIRDVNLYSAVHLDPHKLELQGMRLSALGGQFTGDATMEEFARYQVNGTLRNLDIQTAARAFGQKALPYDGIVSGPLQARGDLKAAGSKLDTATGNLSIAPGRRGIPLTGKIQAEYNGATDNVVLNNSYLALPNTRLNLAGSLNKQMNLDLTTSNLNDLLAAIPGEKPAIRLEGGQARFTGSVVGGLKAPKINGHLSATQFSVEGRRFDALGLDVAAASNRGSVSNGSLQRGPMQAQFQAAVGLKNWSATPNQPLQATASIRNGDLADVMVLAGQPPAGYAGALTVDATVAGTIGNPTGQANLQVTNGLLKDEPFDKLQARVNLADQLITVPAASLQSGPAQITMTAEFQHPRDSMSTGRLHAHVQSNQVDLAQVRNLQKQRPNTAGLLNLTADVTGDLTPKEFLLTNVNADASARGLRFDGQNYGDATAKATTNGQTVRYDLASNFAGSDLKVNGSTQLTSGYPTTADATLRNLPVERVLTLAKRSDIPAKGNLSGTAHFSGTMEKPQGSVDLDLANAVVYEEALDHVRARVSYLPERVDVPLFEVVSGPSRIDLTGRYDHPVNDLAKGELVFQVKSNDVDLAKFKNVQKARPGLGGILRIAASGAATIREGTPMVLMRDLNADVGATGISAQGKNFGDVTLKAATNSGRLHFDLNSNLADAAISGKGDAQLSGDYPLNAELNFQNVTWSKLEPLLSATAVSTPSFEAAADGKVTVSGPVLKTEALKGSAQITKLQLTTIPRAVGGANRTVAIHNDGPLAASLDGGIVKIDSAHLVGPQTDIRATGTVGVLQNRAMNLSLNANTNLGLLQSFSPDIYSSGNILLAATVRGTMDQPAVNGRLELQNASVNHVDFPNGISNANGLVLFNGDTATVQNITAQSGGGQLQLSGYVGLGSTLRLGLRARANSVRVRTQQGVSIVLNTFINLTGTTQSSLLSGTATITRITYAPQSDLGSILTKSGPPVQAPAAPNPLLDNMRLDVRVRTSTATAVQASLAQNIQMDADLRVRGTAAQPNVQGRININEGDLVFFGSTYRVSSGTIAFYNPTRIEPILNVTLETQAKGVTVVLTVTGPVDNMKLSYTSDPPLQFQEIVGLLASGKTPTSDPTLLANQPSQPQQSFQQMGETALVSKAIADPVSSRLERVFGVSQLKIDPTFTSGSELPQARVTLQQQVATNLTFTYVSALNDPNAQIVRIEWSLNPQWSANAVRDENGIFSVNFTYKKQFR